MDGLRLAVQAVAMTEDSRTSLLYSTEVADRALASFTAETIGYAGLDTETLLLSMQRDVRRNGVPDDVGLWDDWVRHLWAASGFSHDSAAWDLREDFFETTVRAEGRDYRVRSRGARESDWPADAIVLSSEGGNPEGFYYDAIVRCLRAWLDQNPDSEDKTVLLALTSTWNAY
ncbi:hypothetical protein C5C94_15565 [Rathayibacter sp. AY1C3]|nr:hypothetical protein C5B92_15500 [Rathayibacter sp. AY1A4]PPH27282.1 hypothetical protein C5C94_15565 [Rathayibacter sp. AY1C3]PPH59356.1 hypothetical protein C5D25_12960 [Rathayibacter sp. AY1D7]PPI27200.1 hypothetical protein C5D66_15975 [Rathayibacter sp. AY1B4]